MSLRILHPSPLFLVGRCRIVAGAFDARGAPAKGIAYVTLSVDGAAQPPDTNPPYEWDLDLGSDLRRRRVVLTAVAADGKKASLAVLSFTHPYVESVGVDLVLVPVVVLEETSPRADDVAPAARPVSGLAAGDFTVLEDGVRQEISSFTNEPIPASISVALDTSRSMEAHLWSARKAVSDFVKEQPAYSALSLMSFNDQVFLEADFTYDTREVGTALGALRPEGTRTALFEALRAGSSQLARRPGARVLVLFTDGEDTVEEGSEGRLRTAIEAAQAADVTVFAVAYGPADAEPLREMAAQTGGDVIQARGRENLSEAFHGISEALGSRYVLGYEPPEPQKPGYRKLEVRVSRAGVRVLARRGYQIGAQR